MDNISCLIILRALYILDFLEKGWCVKKCKDSNVFEIFKCYKKEYK